MLGRVSRLTASIKPLFRNEALDDRSYPAHCFLYTSLLIEKDSNTMTKKQDRKDIVNSIKIAAKLYRSQLVGKRFMYVFDGRYIEVIYKAENFRHLTGVDTFLSARRFYSYAARGILTVSQIGFNEKHPYDLCVRKVKHINEVATMAGSEGFMLEEIKTNTQSYKFGTTDLNFTLCMNKELNDLGNEKGDCFVVQSLRDEDCFSKSNEIYPVTHIFSCANDKKKYTELLFMDKTADMINLPIEVKVRLDDCLLAL